jgi:hypothetical protein
VFPGVGLGEDDVLVDGSAPHQLAGTLENSSMSGRNGYRAGDGAEADEVTVSR